MDKLFDLLILIMVCAIAEPHTMNNNKNQGTDIYGVRKAKPDTTVTPGIELEQIRHQLRHEQSDIGYCEFGGYLEYLSLQCESEKFRELRNKISDVNKPPEIKTMALLASAITVGCKQTAIFLSDQLKSENFKTPNGVSKTCKSSTKRGPEENGLKPCDEKTAELVREKFRSSKKLSLMYHMTSSPLYLTLGCHSLGRVGIEDLSDDLNLTNTKNPSNKHLVELSPMMNNSFKNKAALIMNYVNQHKLDTQITESLIHSVVETGYFDMSNLDTVESNDGNSTFMTIRNRAKRSVEESNIEDRFTIQKGCSIVGSLGVLLESAVSKSECLQLCLDNENCRSAGYTNDNTQWCKLNTEMQKEVGSFFNCSLEESRRLDYYEKKFEPVYFIICSKSRGDVLQATSPTSVEMKSFNENDSQFWYWKENSIYSKKYPQMALSIHIQGSREQIVLKNENRLQFDGSSKWNFANEALTSQYRNFFLAIKNGVPTISQGKSSPNDKWSLSLDRFYFTITCRQSGKVLDASIKDTSEGRLHMWSYHGGDNQFWFWDDDSIRSKKFPGKFLDLHMADYRSIGWGKAYLQTYHGGQNQRWEMKGDNLISKYQNLSLDVKYGNKEDGALVGGKVQNGNTNQRWTFGTYRTFFFILNKQTGKVITATSGSTIKQWHYHGGKNQLWFWDGHVIRNKQYTDRVIDFIVNGVEYRPFPSGPLFLSDFKGTNTQEWKYDDKEKQLVSAVYNFTLSVYNENPKDGASINLREQMIWNTQKWSLTPEHDFFTITSRQDTKVLDASLNTEGKVNMWSFHGGDNQLWFWDSDNIRSKKIPNKVLDLHMQDYQSYNWGKVYLHSYNGGDNQRWFVNDDQIISFYKNLRLDIRNGKTENGAEVGGCNNTRAINQMWSQNAKERIFFTLKDRKSGKVLDAFENFDIGIWTYHGRDNQLWYWDKDSIRSKKYPDKVVDLHMRDFNENGWGKVYLHTYNGGQNQKWLLEGGNVICKFRQLYLHSLKGSIKDGTLAGGYPNAENQRWVIGAVHDKGTSSTNCIDKTEESIYNVVQWIPLVSTLWDLFSSIGYAAAGCKSVAEERAVSMAIGTVMDVATIATGGAASGITTLAKAGIKTGIKFGLKQGMKATIKITQQSVKHLVESATKKVLQSGFRKTIIQGLKKSGKLIIRETLIDPAMFLKNVGKISGKILTRPVKTFKQAWRAASKKIDELKRLKKNFDEFRKGITDGSSNTPRIRCKRAGSGLLSCCGMFSCSKVKKGYSKVQKRQYLELLDSNAISNKVDVCANRYMALTGREYDKVPKYIKDRLEVLSTGTEKAELFSVYQYTKQSGGINRFTQKITDGIPLDHRPEAVRLIKVDVDKFYYQSTLVRSYIKKRPLREPITVYRFEEGFRADLYQNGEVYTARRFMSTTKSNVRIADSGIDLSSRKKHPVEITMNLKTSGVDISDISAYPTQDEVLVPIGTKFNVHKEEVKIGEDDIIKVTLTEI